MAKKTVDVSLKVDTKDLDNLQKKLVQVAASISSLSSKHPGNNSVLDSLMGDFKGDDQLNKLSRSMISAQKEANELARDLTTVTDRVKDLAKGGPKKLFSSSMDAKGAEFTWVLKEIRKQSLALNSLKREALSLVSQATAEAMVAPALSTLTRQAKIARSLTEKMQTWHTVAKAAPGGLGTPDEATGRVLKAFGVSPKASFSELATSASVVDFKDQDTPKSIIKTRALAAQVANFDKIQKLKEEAAKEDAAVTVSSTEDSKKAARKKRESKKKVEVAEVKIVEAKVEESVVVEQTTAEAKADAPKKKGRKKKEVVAEEVTTKAKEQEAAAVTTAVVTEVKAVVDTKEEKKAQAKAEKEISKAKAEAAKEAKRVAAEAAKAAKEAERIRIKAEKAEQGKDIPLSSQYQTEHLQTQNKLADISRATRSVRDTAGLKEMNDQMFSITKEMLNQDNLLRRSKQDQKDIQSLLTGGKLTRKESAEYQELLALELKKSLGIHEAIKNLELQKVSIQKDLAAAAKLKQTADKKAADDERKLLAEIRAEEEKAALARRLAGRASVVTPVGVSSGDIAALDPSTHGAKVLADEKEAAAVASKITDAKAKQKAIVDNLLATQIRLTEESKQEGLHEDEKKAVKKDLMATAKAIKLEQAALNKLVVMEENLQRGVVAAKKQQAALGPKLAAAQVVSLSSSAAATGAQNPIMALGLYKSLQAVNKRLLAELEKQRVEQSHILAGQKDSSQVQAKALAIQERITELGRIQSHIQADMGRLEVTRGQNLAKVQANFTAVRQIFFSMLIGVTSILYPLQRLLDKASEAEKAMNALNRQSRLDGVVGGRMEETVRGMEIVKNGLVSISEAGKTVRNLMRIGFTPDEAIASAKKITEIAIENKQSALTLGQAIVSTTEGFRQELSTLADAGGITKNISVIYKEFAATLGLNAKQLTQRQKALALQAAVDKEAILSAGALEEALFTLGGSMDATRGAMDRFSQTIGLQLKPVVIGVLSVVRRLVAIVQGLMTEFPTLVKILALLVSVVGSGALAFGVLAGVLKLALGLFAGVNFGIQTVAETLFLFFNPAVGTAAKAMSAAAAEVMVLEGSMLSLGAATSTTGAALGATGTAASVYLIGWVAVAAMLASVGYMLYSNVAAAEKNTKSMGALMRETNDLGVASDKTRGKLKSLSMSLETNPMVDSLESVKSKFYELDEVQSSSFYRMRVEGAKTAAELKAVFKDINAEAESSMRTAAGLQLVSLQQKKTDIQTKIGSFKPSPEDTAIMAREFIRMVQSANPKAGITERVQGLSASAQTDLFNDIGTLLSKDDSLLKPKRPARDRVTSTIFGRSKGTPAIPVGAFGGSPMLPTARGISNQERDDFAALSKSLEPFLEKIRVGGEEDLRRQEKATDKAIESITAVLGGKPSSGVDPTRAKPVEVSKFSDVLGKVYKEYKAKLISEKTYLEAAVGALARLKAQISGQQDKTPNKGLLAGLEEVSALENAVKAGKPLTGDFGAAHRTDLVRYDADNSTQYSAELEATAKEIQKGLLQVSKANSALGAAMRQAENYTMQQSTAGLSKVRTLTDFMDTSVLQVDPTVKDKIAFTVSKMKDIIPSLRGIVVVQEDLERLRLQKERVAKEQAVEQKGGGPEDAELRAELDELENREVLLKTEEARIVTFNKLVAKTARSWEKLFNSYKKSQDDTAEGRGNIHKVALAMIAENKRIQGTVTGALDAENRETLQAQIDLLENTDRQLALETITKEHKERLQDADERSEVIETATLKGKRQMLTTLQDKIRIFMETKKAIVESSQLTDAIKSAELRDLAQEEKRVRTKALSMDRQISVQTLEEGQLRTLNLQMTKVNNSYAPVLDRLKEYKRLSDAYRALLGKTQTPGQEQAVRQAIESADAARGKLVPELFEGKGLGITAKAQQLKQYREYYIAHWSELGDSYEQYQERLREISYQTDKFQRGLQLETANALKESFVSGYADVLSRTKTFADVFYDIFKGMMDRLNKPVMEKAVEESFLGTLFDSIAGGLTGLAAGGGGSSGGSSGGSLDFGMGGDAFDQGLGSSGIQAPMASSGNYNLSAPSRSMGRAPAPAPIQINISAMDGASVHRVLTSPAGQKAVMSNINTMQQQYGEMTKNQR